VALLWDYVGVAALTASQLTGFLLNVFHDFMWLNGATTPHYAMLRLIIPIALFVLALYTFRALM